MVKGGGFTENGAEHRRLEVGMVFTNLDSPAKFISDVQMRVLTCSNSGMCFRCYLALNYCELKYTHTHTHTQLLRIVGFCMGNAILAAKTSMCHQITISPDA